MWIQQGLKSVFFKCQSDEKWSPRTCGMGRSVPSFMVTMKCNVKSKVFRETAVVAVSQKIRIVAYRTTSNMFGKLNNTPRKLADKVQVFINWR